MDNGAGKQVDVTVNIKVTLDMPKEGVQAEFDNRLAQQLMDDPSAWFALSQLSGLIAGATQAVAGFTDLTGSAVGTTDGEGPCAQITLDPTSNPNIWQAKAGTMPQARSPKNV